MKMQFKYAPDAGSAGASEMLLPGVDDIDVPNGGERVISLEDDDVMYVDEDSPEALEAARGSSTEPEDIRGKSRDEIIASLMAQRQQLAESAKASEPVTALQQTMSQFLSQMQGPKEVIKPGYEVQRPIQAQTMSDKEFEQYINNLSLENPYQAQLAIQARTMEPLIQTFASSQAQLSREMLFANPSSKKIYDKYAAEIEQVVANTPAVDRVKNPRVYQNAVETVRARHFDEFASEEQEAKLNAMLEAKLKELGISGTAAPAVKAAPANYVAPAQAQRPAQANAKRVVAVPTWVRQEADQKGIDAGFLYSHYKSKGMVK